MASPPSALRSIPSHFSPERLADVDARLAGIIRDHHVTIGLAIESGSRAWGFPSPDSDYDCRFLFVRRREDYLSPWQKRDVIETPLEHDMDVNGWELGKAIKLLLKGNAVVIEWLMSPIVYQGAPEFRDGLLGLANAHTDRAAIARHYLHLGERQRNTYFADHKAISLKKIFYALRPATALRWLRLHAEAAIAPMDFPTLLEQCDPPEAVVRLGHELIERKAVTRELGSGPLPPPLRDFIDDEFAAARACFPARAHRISEDARRDAAAFFRSMLRD
ncbi:nucleotidyltransferase domain-containing protein [Sphingomonas colocasiae]|uniref:Nucleotidyltransferase domain-containing protein n=1 Tax=Sphingomonas colocasiae TaxID=1848973 RepID=A0ABS7PR11_9SPHN|nr:nucleotidyltransferase domain-containing protein [Sphingomonas colocasiae]MBY8822857.1 nucleotidyltransferase domain-containing protein [Sphingomonas colocasiae]